MGTYRVVKLLKNHIYPTYQLHAYMANRKTSPADGLRLAALTTMEWLCLRLGDNAPNQLTTLPRPEQYKEVSNDCLCSFYFNAGFTINIVSLPEQGIWSLQISEPDLGSDPGMPNQVRQPVAGRVLETNIAYRIVENSLECGFQTLISDPDSTSVPADTYRISIIRRLIENSDFGLRHLTPLTYSVIRLESANQFKAMLAISRHEDNALPCVIFTQTQEKISPPSSASNIEVLSSFPSNSLFSDSVSVLPVSLAKIQPLAKPVIAVKDPPYDTADFTRHCVSFCRTYLLDCKLLEKLRIESSQDIHPGDIVVLEPPQFGGSVWTIPYKLNQIRQQEAIRLLIEKIHNYPRNKTVRFGHISFLSTTREVLLNNTRVAQLEAENMSAQWSIKLKQLQTQWTEQLLQKDVTCSALQEQLERQKDYQIRLEQEKTLLRNKLQEMDTVYQKQLQRKDDLIMAFRRRFNQPTEHNKIPEWVVQQFPGRLVLHPKAIALLNEKAARNVNVSLICDALDFLATDYWERRYQNLSTEEMNSQCAEKYGRPFEVKPTGATSIEFTPSQYKIKYFPGRKGKPIESPLDFHLRVGNHAENLLRIYFLHDDEKKLIVVGSLPNHLRAVSIQ